MVEPVPLPKFVVLWPTTKCNARCRHCRHAFEDFGADLADDVLEKVEREVFPHLERVQLVGYGEPLLYRHFERLVEKANAHDVRVTTCTYGSVLDERKSRLLLENGAVLQVSIDGASAATFEHARPTISFEKVMERLEELDRLRDRIAHPMFAMQINCIITRTNLPEMQAMVELADRFRAHLSLFNLFVDTAEEGYEDELAIHDTEDIRRYMAPAVRRAQELGVEFSVPEPYLSIAIRSEEESDPNESLWSLWRRTQRGRAWFQKLQPFHQALLLATGRRRIFPQECPDPYLLTVIGEDGAVYTCCLATELNRVGSLREEGFEEIWNGPAYQEFRRLLKTNRPPRGCQRCNLVEGISKGDCEFFDEYTSLGFLQRFLYDSRRVLRGEI